MKPSAFGRFGRLRAALLLSAAMSTVAGGALAQARTHRFDIPAEAAGDALTAFARQSGIRILFPYSAVAGKRTSALRGAMTDDEALSRLLAETGLQVASRGNGVITLAPRPQPAVAPAAVDPAQLSEVTVTGTHIAGIGPSSSPVRKLGEAEIRASGRTTVQELLQLIPENTGGGVGPEAFNVTGVGVDVTQQGAGANLRGLGQRATLVLLNGGRLAPSGDGSFVDISLIPLAAIGRIEVLTDGASGIYGSDAVGGVVNIILKKDYEGAETSLLVGGSTHGDQDLFQATQAVGHEWDGGHGLLAYQYRKQDPGLSQKHDTSIGVHPDVALIPGQTTESLTGGIGQTFGEHVSTDLTGVYSKSRTIRDYYQGGVSLISARGSSNLSALAGAVSYALPRAWTIKASFDYSKDESSTYQSQASASSLVNNYLSHNGLLEGGLSADGDLLQLPAGPMKLALGAQLRRDTYEVSFISASQVAAGLPAITADRSRRIRSVYVEANIPLFSPENARPGLRRLTLNGAYRYERYSDFGSTSNPKVGVLWEPVDGLRLRGSYDTSFRAPLLSEVGGVYNAFFLAASALAVPGTTAAGPALALTGANPALEPERSKTTTVGVEYRPTGLPGAEFTLNYFRTRYANRIATPTQTLAVLGNPAFAQIVNASPTAAQVRALLDGAALKLDFSGPGFSQGNATPETTTFIIDDRTSNNAVTTASGLDFDLSYRSATTQLTYAASFEGTYFLKFDNRIVSSAPASSLLNSVYQPARLKLRGNLQLGAGAWLGNVSVGYVNSYKDYRFAPIRPVKSFTSVDVSVQYDVPAAGNAWLEGVSLQASVLNLFDQDPPFVSLPPGSTSGVTYDPTNATGAGRSLSLRVTKSW